MMETSKVIHQNKQQGYQLTNRSYVTLAKPFSLFSSLNFQTHLSCYYSSLLCFLTLVKYIITELNLENVTVGLLHYVSDQVLIYFYICSYLLKL